MTQRTFPVVGRLWARLQGRKPATVALGWLQLPLSKVNLAPLCSLCWKKEHTGWRDNFYAEGREGNRWKSGVSLLVVKMNAPTGTQFTVQNSTRLEAINTLSTQFSVVESAKQSGVLTLTLTGNDPERIAHVLDRIANNYLQQNIARREAQDARSLAFCRSNCLKSEANWIWLKSG